MGFIGSFITPLFGITSDDLTDAYYIIDDIIYITDIENENIDVTIKFNIYPSKNDRLLRQNLIGGENIEKTISRSELNDNILEQYYIYSKPLLITILENVLKNKLSLDISDNIPSKYISYHTINDDI